MSDRELNNENGFSLPQDYFASSANALLNRMEWLEEHKSFPALKMAWRENVFAVPDAYFLKKEIATELLPYTNLQLQQGKAVFSKPENSDIQEAAIRLQRFKNPDTFSVPPAYFENKTIQLRALHHQQPEAKVVALRFRRFSFAAAAALIISISWWAYNYLNQPVVDDDCGGIACVDRKEVLQVKTLELLDDDQLLDVVNATALEKSLQKNESAPLHADSVVPDEDLLDAL